MSPLQAWLSSHPDFRALTDADCACPQDLKQTRAVNPAYAPYRAVGDFNKDGREDLAVAVAKAGDKERFQVLIFNDHKAPGPRPPPYVSRSFGRPAALFFGPPAGGERLLVGPFESEGVAFVPTDRGGYRIEDGL